MHSIIFTLVERGFGWNLVRNIFGWLDTVVFTLFSWVMGLLFDIASVTTNSDLSGFYDGIQSRVYIIMTVFMLFKVIISMITYVVNPDSISDKSQGAGKLVIRIILSLIMLIGFPIVFKELNELQGHIIDNGTVQKIVLGSSGAPNMVETADDISIGIYNGTFFTENNGSKVTTIDEPVSKITIPILVDHINDEVPGNRNAYRYTYMPVIGTVTGIVMTFIVLGMCIDIAVRVFKLIVLELIAPIPILSYIDPKQSKEGTFSKWLKMVISTWAEIFIKLFIIYFIVLVITKVINGGAQSIQGSPLVKLLLVIGLLVFAKDAPKFICDSIGVKAPDKGGIGSMFGRAVLGGTVGAAAGLVAGGAGGMAAGALSGLNGGFHGNKVGDTLKQGLDLGTQVKTGGEQTKWKNMIQKAQETSMQHSAARKLGYGSIKEANDAFGDIKAAKERAEGIFAEAESAYQSGGSYTYQGRTYSGENLRNLIYGDGGLRVNSLKATSKFNDFSAHLGAYGMGSKVDSSLTKATKAKNDFGSGAYVTNASNFRSDDDTLGGGSPAPRPAPTPAPDVDDIMDQMADAQNAIIQDNHNAQLDQQGLDYTQQYANPNGSSNSSNAQDTAGDRYDDIFGNQ